MGIWYVARGAGLAALVLLSVSVGLGALTSARIPCDPSRRIVVQYMHRSLASLSLAVLGLHLSMILADSYAHVGAFAAAVPFTSSYRATWVGLGSIAGYTVLLAAATGALRGRLTRTSGATTAWRVLHGLSYGGWALAMLHGLKSGTDSSLPWVRWLYVGCLVAVVVCVGARVVLGPETSAAATTTSRSPARRMGVAR